jgi:hypothetical protein
MLNVRVSVLAVVFLSASLICPAIALAGHTTGTIKGRLLSQNPGACEVGYSSFCPSGTCICDIFTGTISGNPIGKGTAELWLTIDEGAALSGGSTCLPLFGSFAITTSRDSEVIDTVGSACNIAGGTADTLSGGFGISQSAVGAKAWGNLTGTFDFSTGSGVVKYSGTTF